MQDLDYRNTIIEATDLLSEMEQRLFTAMVNVGMYGVYKEVHEVFCVGDIYHFESEHFEDTGDANLSSLMKLIEQVALTRSQLVNLNALPEINESEE
ncbi:MAG: hypothetical protein EOP04_20430 [Proteobacteria bacterium]|nr:MAG: hypothetical protein EOP04_20430 [Pseudomonadota bacterium]